MSAEQPLPRSWTETTLDSLLHRIEAGLNVKCEERPPNLGEKGLVKISAVTWGQFDELQSKTLPASETPVPSNRIQPGDLLISRANTIELVGSSVIVKELQRELYLSDKVLRLVVHEPSKRWINYALKTPALRKAIEDGSSGNQLSMRNISQEKLKALPLPLAPEAEQKRIADKLDTVLTRVDAVNTRLARVAPLLKRFRQSVLAAATSGRLTEDWREIRETAPWTDKRIEDVAKVFLGRQRSPVNHEGPFMRRYVRAANVTWSGWDLSDVKEMNFDADDFERYRLQKNDILLNEGSGSADEVGKPAIWNEEIPDCCFQNTLICVRPETVDAKFMFLVLLHAALTKRFVDSTRGVNIHHIGKQNMARFPVAVPNADEQTEIVRRVETLFALADRLEARLAQAQTAATRLTPALLAKAFRGELVPQDPNDEPAAELLRRLQAERATAPKASAGRGRKAVVQS